MKENFLGIDTRFLGALEGKTVMITGAGSGLGKAIALGLPFAGAKVGVLDLNATAVKATADRINEEYEKKAFPLVASVTDFAQLAKAYEELSKNTGGIDVLVNCAGIAKLGPINELNEKDIKMSNDVNVNGYFLNAAIAAKYFITKKSGVIVNISSASARGASENSSLYGMAKEAQCMMTRSWALDLGKHGIRVNTILAGDLYGDEKLGISSGIWNQQYFEKKAIDKWLISAGDKRIGEKQLNPQIRAMVIEHYAKRTALGEQITYKDIVEAIIYLSSPLSSKITGESIAITAGNSSAFGK